MGRRPNRNRVVTFVAVGVPLAVASGVTAATLLVDRDAPTSTCQATTVFTTGISDGIVFPDRDRLPGAGGSVVIDGVTRDADCAPVGGVVVRYWAAQPDGTYTDDSYGQVTSGADGRYRIETFSPGAYPGARPHVHISAYIRGVEVRTEVHPDGREGTYPLDLVPPNAAPVSDRVPAAPGGIEVV